MKILLQNQYDSLLGGVETYFQLIVDALIEKGNEIIAVYTQSGKKPNIQKNGYKAFYLPNIEKDISLLRSIVIEEKPRVIHLNNTHYPSRYSFLSRYAPVIQTVHDFFHCCPTLLKILPEGICESPFGMDCFKNRCISWKNTDDLRRFRAGCINREAMKKFERLLVVTPYMKNMLIDNGFREDKIQELLLFAKDLKLDIKQVEDNIIVYAGRLAKEKGVTDFIHMLKALSINYKAFIIGDGPQKDECESLVNTMGLNNRVKFTGFLGRDSINEYFKKASVIIIPSLWPEPFCLVGIEAMAHSKPVVAYAVGGISSWLRDNYNGFLAHRGDIAGLVHRVETLLKNRKLAEDMGKNGRWLFEKNFSENTHISKLLSVYESVALSGKIAKKRRFNMKFPLTAQYKKHRSPEILPGEPLPDYNKRLINFEIENGISVVRSYPEEITISTTTKCNMEPPCVICERNLRTKNLEYDIDAAALERIKPIFKYADRIYLHCGGEPLMTGKIFDIIESVKPPTKIIFNTNGALFTEKTIRYTADRDVVDVISFSLDAATEKTYKRIRSADFNKVIGNIEALIKYRNEKNKAKPLLRPLVLLNFCIFKQNIMEVPDYVLLAHRLGADGIDFSHLNEGFDWQQKRADYLFDYKRESVLNMENVKLHDNLIREAYRLSKIHKIPINFNGNPFISEIGPERKEIKNSISEIIKYNKKCPAPWSRAVIETDGRVRICYFHHSAYETIGKLRNDNSSPYYLQSESFEEIWNGEEAVSVRKEFMEKGIAKRCVTKNPCIFQNRI